MLQAIVFGCITKVCIGPLPTFLDMQSNGKRFILKRQLKIHLLIFYSLKARKEHFRSFTEKRSQTFSLIANKVLFHQPELKKLHPVVVARYSIFTYCTSDVPIHCNEYPIYVLPEKEVHGLSPNSYIQHLCVCERFKLYIPTYLAAEKWADRSWEHINLSQILEFRNWQTEHYNSVLEITGLYSFIFGNT